jgi:basic membrane protein A and related proteins
MATGLLSRLSGSLTLVAAVAVPMGLALLTPAAAARQATPAASPIASPAATSAEPVFAPACEVPQDRTYKVAMVIAQGGLGDQSYNDLADAGLTRAEADFPIEAQRIQSPDIVAQGQAVLQQAGQAGFDLVVDLEFSTADALAAIGPTFPGSQWMIVNLPSSGPNITGYLFNEQDGSYLAGALAALVTTDASVPGINPEKVIGAIGGVQSTGIDKFIVGYIQGARDIDPEVKVLVNYSNGFGDPARGKELADAMFGQGADIVYQIAGGTGAGIIQAAEQADRYAIGVDTDQDGLAPGAVLTSMIKRTDYAVYDAINRLVCGQLAGGETVTLGLAEGAVGLSPMTYTRDLIPTEFLDRVAELRQRIIDGEIAVWNVIDQGYPEFYRP